VCHNNDISVHKNVFSNSQPPATSNLTPFRITQSGGLFAALLGLLALVGWALDLPVLSTFGYAFIPMAPSTAILFLIFGSALYFGNLIIRNRRNRLLATVVIVLGTLAATLLYSTSVRGIFHATESLGMHLDVMVPGTPIGHMSPITAALFFFVGLALLLLVVNPNKGVKRSVAGLVLSLPVFLAASFLLLAYQLGAPAFYNSTTIPPALPTALGFFGLSASLLAWYAKTIWFSKLHLASLEIRPVISLAMLFLLLASGIILIGHHNHRGYARQFRQEAEEMLQAIGTFKTSEIVHWKKERLDDANILFRNPYLSRLARNHLNDPENPGTLAEMGEMLRFMYASQNYDLFGLYDMAGNKLMTYPEEKGLVSDRVLEKIPAMVATREPGFLDFYYNDSLDNIFLAVVVPVFDPELPESVIATMVLRIDPEHYLYPLISGWPGSSETAETLLVRQEGNEVVYLNELRFADNTALNLRFQIDQHIDRPAVMAAGGQEGIVEGLDYRGVPVFASLHKVPDSDWFLVARMDSKEVYMALGQHLKTSILSILLLIGLTGVGVFLGWRQQQLRFLEEKMLATEASDRLKTAFMNNISHELRTPLNSILGFGQVMMQPGLSDDNKKEFLAMVQNSSDRLLATVNNYMDMSLLASGNLEFHPKPYGVKAMLSDLYQEFQPRCIAKGLELELLSEKSEKVIQTSDAELVKKVMALLLDNALKFTQKGNIAFGYRKDGNEAIEYFVQDTGVGISRDSLQHLYKPYWQEEDGSTSHYEGSGLGLPIARGIIDRMGGTITVETEKGKGSSFYVRIPGPVVAEEVSKPASVPHGAAMNGKKPLVLIAEDDENNAQYYAFALEKVACELVFAVNGREAVEVVKSRPDVSLVLMDLKMPLMNGFDATREIKSLYPNLPVVATTAYAMTHDEKRAREAGCDDYLSKPIRPAMLNDTLVKYGVITRNGHRLALR
jgi:signal transduction histidine kinase/CheY-like chemotaxis protein